jgi:broad specificity phosphatase PhoE
MIIDLLRHGEPVGAHVGVIRAIVAHVLAAPPLAMYHIKVNNAGRVRIRINQLGAKLESLNR